MISLPTVPYNSRPTNSRILSAFAVGLPRQVLVVQREAVTGWCLELPNIPSVGLPSIIARLSPMNLALKETIQAAIATQHHKPKQRVPSGGRSVV